MTKLKSKKMSKSTFAIIIMAIAMVAMLAFGGTYAYFTSEASGDALKGTATAGKIALDAANTKLTYTATVNVLPGEPVFSGNGTKVTITDLSNRESYIFIDVTATVAKKAGGSETVNLDGTLQVNGENLQKTGSTYYILTTSTTKGTAIDVTNIQVSVPADWDNTYQEATITVEFSIKQVQAAGFDSAEEALAQYKQGGGINA